MKSHIKSLAFIRHHLPVGGIKEICIRTGYSRFAVYSVFNGKTKLNLTNIKIIETAQAIIKEFTENEAKLNEVKMQEAKG